MSKVPEVTLIYWIIKIAATTLGETGGDTATMTLNWGYLAGRVLFLAALLVLVAFQIAAKKFHPWLYWATIVASTTAGTTMADFADRSLGIGYTAGSATLFLCLMAVLGLWYWVQGSISVETVTTPQVKRLTGRRSPSPKLLALHLVTGWPILLASVRRRRLVFAASLALLAVLNFSTKVSCVFLFWAGFVLTRPLGATVGDFLDKPLGHGGLAFSHPIASAVIAAFIVVCLILLPQRAGRNPAQFQAT
jgi:uncharacterized membrane-anchored protein